MPEIATEIPVALCFVGPVQHPFTQSLRNALCGLANEGISHLTLLISSNGGSIGEGFALYNLMRSLPYTIHAHNIGSVESIANIIFVAADHRSCAPESFFMFHGFTWSFQQETLDEPQISERTGTLATGRTQYVKIFESRTNWGPAQFEDQNLFGRAKVITPDDALKAGIVHQVSHLSLPPGTRVLNVAA